MSDSVFKLGATYGDIKGVLPIEYEKLCFPFVSLSFFRLIILVGSGVTVDLHAGVHSHTNNFINILLILHQSYNFIRFEPLL